MPKMPLNSAVFIKGNIEAFKTFPKPGQPAEPPRYTFRIMDVIMLTNVVEEYLKGFSLKISTPQLNPDFRTSLVKLVKRHRGKTPLSIFLFDPGTRYNIEFLSKKFQVDVTNDFISDIRTMNIEYETIRR